MIPHKFTVEIDEETAKALLKFKDLSITDRNEIIEKLGLSHWDENHMYSWLRKLNDAYEEAFTYVRVPKRYEKQIRDKINELVWLNE